MVCVGTFGFLRLHQTAEADFRFEINMGRDINRIGRDLKAAGLEDKTVRIVKSALEDVQRNTHDYVQSRSYDAIEVPLFSILLVMMFVAASAKAPVQGIKPKNPFI
jgi:hypothetical protein